MTRLCSSLSRRKQLTHLALEQLRDRHAGPPAHDVGDVLFVDFFFEQAVAGAAGLERRLVGVQSRLQLAQLAVAQFGGPVEIVLPLGLFDLDLDLLDLRAQRRGASGRRPFRVASAPAAIGLLAQFGELFLDAARGAASMRRRSLCAAPRARSPVA